MRVRIDDKTNTWSAYNGVSGKCPLAGSAHSQRQQNNYNSMGGTRCGDGGYEGRGRGEHGCGQGGAYGRSNHGTLPQRCGGLDQCSGADHGAYGGREREGGRCGGNPGFGGEGYFAGYPSAVTESYGGFAYDGGERPRGNCEGNPACSAARDSCGGLSCGGNDCSSCGQHGPFYGSVGRESCHGPYADGGSCSGGGNSDGIHGCCNRGNGCMDAVSAGHIAPGPAQGCAANGFGNNGYGVAQGTGSAGCESAACPDRRQCTFGGCEYNLPGDSAQ
eukprot:1294988-Pleurochrysis_carterae.AAC.3